MLKWLLSKFNKVVIKKETVYVCSDAKYKVGDLVYGYYVSSLSNAPKIVQFTVNNIEIRIGEKYSNVKYNMTWEDADNLGFDKFYWFSESDISDDLEELKMRVANKLFKGVE